MITSTAGTTATEDTEYTYAPAATDSDNTDAELTWSISGQPTGMAIDSASGAISWTPLEGVTTSGTVTITVSDNESPALTDTETFTVTVAAVNDAPVISTTAGTTATEDIEFTYAPAATDSDNTNAELTWSISGEPTGMTIDNASGAISWTPLEGITTSGAVTITVSDNESPALTDTETFTVSVTAVNDAPVISTTAGTAATEDIEFTYAPAATDSDNTDAELTWSISGEPTGMTIDANSGAISWTPLEGVTTSGAVTITVSDNESPALTHAKIFTVAVTAVNDAPVITTTAGTAATEDTEYTYAPAATDSDNTDAELTWSISGEPTSMTIDANSGAISWTPLEGVSTSGAVTITVSDNESPALTHTETFTVAVTAVNDAPAITTTAGTAATEDIEFTYAPAATDSDNTDAELTWSISGDPQA